MNVRHVSLYNEINVVYDLSITELTLSRNINCISLNQSLKYSINNFSIDMGYAKIDTTALSSLFFPIRFYLSDTPVNDAIAPYTTTSLTFNGVSSPTSFNYNQIDISDSSNNINNNYLELVQTTSIIDYNLLKTNTVFETFINQISQTRSLYSLPSTAQYGLQSFPINTNNFSFNSRNEQNLAISIFPSLFSGTSQNFSGRFIINFDLIEESL